MVGTYYLPSSSVGELVPEACAGLAPHNVLKISANPASMRIVLSGEILRIMIYLPAGTSARFLDDEFQIEAAGQSQSVPLGEVRYSDPKARQLLHMSSTGEFIGGDIHLAFGQRAPIEYWTDVKLPVPDQNDYEVKMPRVEIDGTMIAIPAVHFSRRVGVGFGPINC